MLTLLGLLCGSDARAGIGQGGVGVQRIELGLGGSSLSLEFSSLGSVVVGLCCKLGGVGGSGDRLGQRSDLVTLIVESLRGELSITKGWMISVSRWVRVSLVELTHESRVGFQGGKLGLSISSLSCEGSGLGCVVMGDLCKLGIVGSNGNDSSIRLDLIALGLDGQGFVGAVSFS